MKWWLYIRLVIIFVSLIIGVVSIVAGAGRRRSTGKIIGGVISLLIAFASACIDGNVGTPSISISEDRSSIVIEADKGAEIYYMLSAGEDRDKWIRYDGPISDIENNTVVTAKASFSLTKDSEEAEMEVKVDSNSGRLYRLIEKTEASVKSISAEYNYRDFDGETPGNSYAGYHVSGADFTVKCTLTDGSEEEIDPSECTYEPEVLAKGDNTITVTYEQVGGNTKTDTVVVTAGNPQIVSISASLKEGERAPVNSTLSTSQFTVKAKLEDGSLRTLEPDEFTIFPEEVTEGTSEITVTAGDKTATVKINASSNSSKFGADDGNNEFSSAKQISLGEKVYSRLSETERTDYFKINILDEKGCVSLHLGHGKIDDDNTFWEAALFSDEENSLVMLDSSGRQEETSSAKARLSKGTYYIRVQPYYYLSEEEYWIEADYEPVDEFSETEPDDDYQSAYPITEFATEYEGNLQNEDDEDFYKFTVESKGKVTLSFAHDQFDNDNTFWDVTLSGENDKELTKIESNGKNASLSSDAVRIKAGTYYIKVSKHYYHDSRDYKLCVNYEPEGDGYESEPDDDYGSANPLTVGSSIIGNCQNKNDVDFYKIDLTGGTGNLTISLNHNLIDSEYNRWSFQLLSGTSGESITNVDKKDYTDVKGNENATASWTGLEPNIYYLKVEPTYSQYCNEDYTIQVSGGA